MARIRASKVLGMSVKPPGVYETDSLPGIRQIELISSDGCKRGVIMLHEEWVDGRIMGEFQELLDRHREDHAE